MRVRAAVARAAAVAIIGCAGCSSSPAHQRSPAPSSLPGGARPSPGRALPSPGCSIATAKQPLLGGQRLLVSNYASGQLEAVSVPSIP